MSSLPQLLSMASMQNTKRKRESHDMAGGRAAPGMVQSGHDFAQHYLQTDDDGMDNMDFATALAHSAADGSSDQMHAHGGDGSGQSTTDTAAAAMAQYHTMTVPQSTESSFMAQPTQGGDGQVGSSVDQGGSGVQQRNSSFGDFDISGVQSSPNGNTSPTAGPTSGTQGTPKPPVGSEEWHKVRKDNHKEGILKHLSLCITRDL